MLTFPRAFSRELRPFFRLLEEPFLTEGGSPSSSLFRSPSASLNNFTPSFDVKETKDSYILDGELPGIADKSNLDIQFVDPQTLVIKGRIERSSSSGNDQADAATTNTNSAATPADTPNEKPRKPTVEDEADAETSSVNSEKNTETTVEKSGSNTVAQNNNNNNGHRYWVQERMVGEFQRSFSFPHNIDQDAVKASLKDGILSVVVPKKNVSDAPRRIQIE